MTDVVRRLPRALRVGSVVTLVTALLTVAVVQWFGERDRSRENLKLYEVCLNSAQDVAQVKECTKGYYVRRDGREGGTDPLQVTAATERLQELGLTTDASAALPPRPSADAGDPTTAPGDVDVAPGRGQGNETSEAATSKPKPSKSPNPNSTRTPGLENKPSNPGSNATKKPSNPSSTQKKTPKPASTKKPGQAKKPPTPEPTATTTTKAPNPNSTKKPGQGKKPLQAEDASVTVS